ncbi:hypothetical protein CFAM422_004715 [Trichoderma lentiforme]|uniref:Uncharacterized protein n=1 Tax=Trichoderma lentiforme TaxID=1567552 RepID=A0A9P5CGA5_9HYPO|nr:hypothetical protein CFAM422_004715 [Trichoderma lentiforme]
MCCYFTIGGGGGGGGGTECVHGLGTSTCNENCTREAAFCLVRRASASAHALPANKNQAADLICCLGSKADTPDVLEANEASPRMPAADQQPPCDGSKDGKMGECESPSSSGKHTSRVQVGDRASACASA